MSSKRWKVGLLGAGYIIDVHAKSLINQDNVDIVAVCDHSVARAESAALSFNIPQVFSSLDEMLKTDLDAVHILLPPDLHFDCAKQIIESGRHVFLEKPMGTNQKECQALDDLAKEHNVKVSVNHNFVFLSSYEKLREDVADGVIGKLDHVNINWFSALPQIQFGPFNIWMLQKPENLIFELGPHLIAFLVDLLGVPDDLKVDVSLPIDLPGGNRVYRHWHIYGNCGKTSFDLNLSVIPGYTDKRISVRGHAATATCLFDRDIYYIDEPSGAGLLFDNFLSVKNVAWQVGKNSIKNLFKSVKGTLQKSPSANPFGECINKNIHAFYQTLEGQYDDTRMLAEFGVKVISVCERIAEQAVFSASDKTNEEWNVLPALTQPTVLVLGGSGFIGSYLVKSLTEKGLGVRVVTRGLGAANIALKGLPVELIQGDLASAEFMDEALEGIDVVYHLAKANGDNWADYYKHDVLVTQNIAERALAKGVKRFIYTGTIDSYYSADSAEVITMDTLVDPKIKSRNHYARSKATCEALLTEIFNNQGLPLVIFRPGVVIGKGCPPAHWGVGMFQSETRMQFWGSGETKLPLVLVEDVASALTLGIDKPNIEGKTFLLTDGPFLSGKEYVDIVSKEIGTKIRSESTSILKFYLIDMVKEAAKNLINHPNKRRPTYRDWDSRSHRAQYDSSKTQDILGWKPAGTRDLIIKKGVIDAAREYFR
ncbi:MAG: NAD-dependent epimerase/dehydratase family protein [Methylophaga sp.]|nr:NAD-dependent epimerase/dehydratase family protein [Methylophaga sp.]